MDISQITLYLFKKVIITSVLHFYIREIRFMTVTNVSFQDLITTRIKTFTSNEKKLHFASIYIETKRIPGKLKRNSHVCGFILIFTCCWSWHSGCNLIFLVSYVNQQVLNSFEEFSF